LWTQTSNQATPPCSYSAEETEEAKTRSRRNRVRGDDGLRHVPTKKNTDSQAKTLTLTILNTKQSRVLIPPNSPNPPFWLV
jgi:hypothetical protein